MVLPAGSAISIPLVNSGRGPAIDVLAVLDMHPVISAPESDPW
jgi:hypothetical protein